MKRDFWPLVNGLLFLIFLGLLVATVVQSGMVTMYHFVFLFGVAINLWLVWGKFWHKIHLTLGQQLAFSLLAFYPFLVYFLGVFWAYQWWFLVANLIFIGSLGLLRNRWLPITALSIFMVIFGLSFEEDYCWHQGELADPGGSKMVVLNEKQGEELKNYSMGVGSTMSQNWVSHMSCHVHFSFGGALMNMVEIKTN